MIEAVLAIHIAAGISALPAGAWAVAVRKGSRTHARAGTIFSGAMLVLGITAAILEPFRDPPGSPLVGIFVCYFVATAWVSARRRSGVSGLFEKLACATALATASLAAWEPLTAGRDETAGANGALAFAALLLVAGLLDLKVVIHGRLSTRQRTRRHLWRMCFGFFIATGSFFLGQQDLLPAAMRGSPLLLAVAFAPFAIALFWLIRLRGEERTNGSATLYTRLGE